MTELGERSRQRHRGLPKYSGRKMSEHFKFCSEEEVGTRKRKAWRKKKDNSYFFLYPLCEVPSNHRTHYSINPDVVIYGSEASEIPGGSARVAEFYFT